MFCLCTAASFLSCPRQAMGSRKISTEYDLLHVEKLWKGEQRDNDETIKNKILRRKMFWISVRERKSVTLFNTFPPDLTAVQVISKQLHGNRRLCQILCCNSCCTSWGHGRPLGPGPSEVWDLNETLSNIKATGDDRSLRLDRITAADSWPEVSAVGSQLHAVALSCQAGPGAACRPETWTLVTKMKNWLTYLWKYCSVKLL